MKTLVSLIVASLLWIPNIHHFYDVDLKAYKRRDEIAPKALMLAERHLELWRDPVLRAQELKKMQRRNPEWDFMSRTYFVLALANMALHDRKYQDLACEIIDAIIENTLIIERERGPGYFLLPYARRGAWAIAPPRSQFIDGEIALMLATRRFIKEDTRYQELLRERVEVMVQKMEQSPVLSAESYPHECWLFCNTVALAAMRMMDSLDGTDHSWLLKRWVRAARAHLTHESTGLLISTYNVEGVWLPAGRCPEGSTIYMSAHMLQVIDPDFARDQYDRAHRHLGRNFAGFQYAKEWANACQGDVDIDSGPIIPFLEASAASSGMAVLGAAAFGDHETLAHLLKSLEFVGFPHKEDGQLRYRASNPVGDSVLLYGLVEGPLWRRVLEDRS